MKMPADGATKKQWGGKRPGAGRPCTDTIVACITIQRKTASVLARIAKKLGRVQRQGAPPFLGAAVDELASRVTTLEPEYLRIAREIREQSSHSADTSHRE